MDVICRFQGVLFGEKQIFTKHLQPSAIPDEIIYKKGKDNDTPVEFGCWPINQSPGNPAGLAHFVFFNRVERFHKALPVKRKLVLIQRKNRLARNL
jgi:hypothetical protein